MKDDIALPDAARPSVPSELVARLEAASAGSRELTEAVARHFGWRTITDEADPTYVGRITTYWLDPAEGDDPPWENCPPDFTTSLDAALALAERVLPGWGLDIGFPCRLGEHGGRPWASVWPPNNSGLEPALNDKWGRCNPANAAGLPLALCIAILKAADTPPDTGTGTEGGR